MKYKKNSKRRTILNWNFRTLYLLNGLSKLVASYIIEPQWDESKTVVEISWGFLTIIWLNLKILSLIYTKYSSSALEIAHLILKRYRAALSVKKGHFVCSRNACLHTLMQLLWLQKNIIEFIYRSRVYLVCVVCVWLWRSK